MSRIIAALIISITFVAVVLFPQTIKNTVINKVGHEKLSPMDW